MDISSLTHELSFTMAIPMGRCQIASRRPIYNGNIKLMIRKKKHVKHQITVFVKLFEECPKHYAVIYRNDDCEHRYGCFDYRTCVVRPVPGNNRQFDVTSADSETGLRFEVDTIELAAKWMEAFRCNKYCPYSPRNMRTYGTSTKCD